MSHVDFDISYNVQYKFFFLNLMYFIYIIKFVIPFTFIAYRKKNH